MDIGEKIKMLRALRGFTQEELANKINKTRALVSHIEQTGKINNYTLTAILKTLNITTEDFEKFDGKNVLKPIANKENENIVLLKERLEHYQKENKSLREIIISQTKLINLLERKKKK